MAQFAIIPARAVEDRGLSRGALLVLCAVGLHANSDGWCWPSQSRLAELAGISRQMVGRYLAELEQGGYLQRRPRIREDGGRSSDQIRILYDARQHATTVAPPATLEVAPPATLEVAPPATLEVALMTKKNSPKNDPIGNIEIPHWVPADDWRAFREMRKKIRAPMTDDAVKRIVSDLGKLKLEGHDPGEVLMQSVKNSWRGVFPLRNSSQQRKLDKLNADALAEFEARRKSNA